MADVLERPAESIPRHVTGAAAPRPTRLHSLDILRGFTIAAMIAVNATTVLEHVPRPVFPVLLHAPWAGFTVADAVFPAFITMVGLSIAVSAKPGSRGPGAAKILGRAARLILLGLLLVNMFLLIVPDLAWPPRFPGVLQRIGIVYALTAFLYPVTGTRARIVGAAVILLAYWGICLLPVPDGAPVDLLAQGHNFVSWVDRSVFGSWVTGQGTSGYDPEGIISTLPTFAQALIGTVAGDFLRRDIPRGKLSWAFILIGAAGVLLALAWNVIYPIAKPIWTSSFVLLSAGLTLIALGALHYLCDGQAPGGKGGPLGSLGRNSIAAYTLHYLLLSALGLPPFLALIDLLAPLVGARWAALAPVAVFFLIVWAPLALMDRKGWYWRI